MLFSQLLGAQGPTPPHTLGSRFSLFARTGGYALQSFNSFSSPPLIQNNYFDFLTCKLFTEDLSCPFFNRSSPPLKRIYLQTTIRTVLELCGIFFKGPILQLSLWPVFPSGGFGDGMSSCFLPLLPVSFAYPLPFSSTAL